MYLEQTVRVTEAHSGSASLRIVEPAGNYTGATIVNAGRLFVEGITSTTGFTLLNNGGTLVARSASALGGTLSLEHAPGGGTVVAVKIKLAASAPPAATIATDNIVSAIKSNGSP